MLPPIVNIAAYRFCKLGSLVELRAALKLRCVELGLKGTILLSPEGINLSLAGSRGSVDAAIAFVRTLPGCEAIQPRESLSLTQPFKKMMVKLKREIIAFGVAGIDPATYTSRRITAEQLAEWFDTGKEFVLLDTRNDYETAAGTFKNAVTLPLDDFRNFPRQLSALPEGLKHRPVVTFCTGGIRCEKAAPFLEQAGYTDVYQLEGGILQYFARCGHAHYQGTCFVFDGRESLNAELKPHVEAS